MNKTASIATRFEVYPIVEHECGSPQPIHKTEYDDLYIIYEYGFDMHTGQKVTRKKDKFDDEKFIKIKTNEITSSHTRYDDEDSQQTYYGFVIENTHLHMKMDLYIVTYIHGSVYKQSNFIHKFVNKLGISDN